MKKALYLRIFRKYKALKKVEHTGFEPVTSSMPWRRAPNCANAPQQTISYHRWQENANCFLFPKENEMCVLNGYDTILFDRNRPLAAGFRIEIG